MKPKFSKEQLYDLYINKRLSIRQIGKIFNISHSTIHHWLKKYNIPTRFVSETNKNFKISKRQLYDLYVNQKLSTCQIAKMFDVSDTTIRNKLRKYSIFTRSYSESGHLRQANHCSLTQKATEWLNGELLGDGSLHSCSKYSACFQYTSKYKEYIEYVSKTLDSFGVKQCGKIRKNIQTGCKGKTKQYKFKKSAIVYLYSSLFYEELLPIKQKWYPNDKKIVPKDIELTPLTIRQWMIGDGCLKHPKDSNPSIVLSTMGFTVEDVEFLVNKLNDLGFKCTRQPSNNTIYISAYSTSDFLNYIGECPVKCYEYKWNI